VSILLTLFPLSFADPVGLLTVHLLPPVRVVQTFAETCEQFRRSGRLPPGCPELLAPKPSVVGPTRTSAARRHSRRHGVECRAPSTEEWSSLGPEPSGARLACKFGIRLTSTGGVRVDVDLEEPVLSLSAVSGRGMRRCQ